MTACFPANWRNNLGHMARKAKRAASVRDFSILIWTDKTPESELRLAFKSKWDWVVAPHMSSAAWHSTVLANLLRTYTRPQKATVDVVRNVLVHGLHKEAFTRLKGVIDASGDELSQAVRIPARTIARREVFKPDESERIFRVASAFQRAIEVLGSLEKARRWFSSPKRALGNKTPMEFCDTELGAGEVTNLLGRIEHGVFS
jgi:putative toxin-antitoxin system antitoxin component (TIGR02293 family)